LPPVPALLPYTTLFRSGREYEDRVERLALRRLLPAEGGRRLLEVGAGFGRLTNEYNGYRQVVLLDYSLSQLQYAQEQLGRSERRSEEHTSELQSRENLV